MAIGNVPGTGFQLIDGQWANGLSQGHNLTYQSGLTAAGANQAGALQLADLISNLEIDTAAGSTGVALPLALAGMRICLFNNGASTLTVYPSIANNAAGNQDTINNTTSLSVNSHAGVTLACAKTGNWFQA
jgi:hypothetical protein